MPFSRARYVTLCQQSLVTAAVLALGVSAAGVKTLDIVPQPGAATATDAQPGAVPQEALAEHAQPAVEDPVKAPAKAAAKAPVDVAPVNPKVHEVRVSGISAKGPNQRSVPKSTPKSTPRKAVEKTQEKAPEKVTPQAPEKRAEKRVVALSEPTPVQGYATVGVTWQHGVEYAEDQLAVQVRTEKNGAWSGWMTAAYHDDHGPDGGSNEEEARNERPGTDALVIGDVDQVQMRAESTTGIAPPDLKLAVIDPGAGTMVKEAPAIDTANLPAPQTTAKAPPASATTASATTASYTTTSASTSGDAVALAAMKVAPKPVIYSRAQWGANEKLRDQSAPSYGTVKTGFIHHTVNANTYTAAQVPALLRGIYAYHTQSRGWRDIGYNYLVDRFGRIWEGRYGGVDRAVVGAHTLGYNEVSFAMSAIGNYDIASPPQVVLNAYASLFAWKLSLYNIRADTPKILVKGKYLQAINGHRDVGQTACPGRYLYAQIPAVRKAAQTLQNVAQGGAPVVTPPVVKPPVTPKPSTDVMTAPTQTPRPATTQPGGITFPRSLNLAGDAKPDLVLKARNGAISVIPTAGQTGFRAAVGTKGSWSGFDQLVAVGDVTGDGRGDVLGRARTSKVTSIFRGDGAGHVLRPAIAATRSFRYATMITGAGDWNRDGRNDVLMRDPRGRLKVLLGLGNGRFGKGRVLATGWNGIKTTSVAGDLNRDGRPDIVAIANNGYVYVAANRGYQRIGLVRRQYVGKAYTGLVGGGRDMTGDGYGDVVVKSAKTGQVLILPGKSGGFGAALGPFDQGKAITRLTAGQMAGGAQPDLVGTNAGGTMLLVVANNGLANLAGRLASNLSVPDATQVLNVGDWNKDGRGDVITRQAAGDALVLRRGLGNGKFAPGVVMSRGWKTFTNLAAVGDVTGDGRPDLVGRTKTGKPTIFPGNGGAGFLAPVLAPNYLKSFNLVGVGTWKPQRLPGSAFISSDGSLVPFVGLGMGDLRSYDWVLGPGDLDGDGTNDLVARDAAGTMWLLPGTSNGYGARRLLATGFSGYSVGG